MQRGDVGSRLGRDSSGRKHYGRTVGKIRQRPGNRGLGHRGQKDRFAGRRQPEAQRRLAAREPDPFALRRQLQIDAVVDGRLLQSTDRSRIRDPQFGSVAAEAWSSQRPRQSPAIMDTASGLMDIRRILSFTQLIALEAA